MLDHGIKIASTVYESAQPALQDYDPQVEKRVTSGVRAVKEEYGTIRDRLVNEIERAGNAIANVRSKIADLGF